MSYDCQWRIIPDHIKAAVTDATETFRRLADARDALGPDTPEGVLAQAEVDVAYEALSTANVATFSVNNYGMGVIRDVMARTDMVYTASHEPLSDDWAAAGDDEEALDALRALRDEQQPGIPFHKFCTNDGWIVTPEEIQGALLAWEMADTTAAAMTEDVHAASLFVRWLDFLRLAATEGNGFVVW